MDWITIGATTAMGIIGTLMVGWKNNIEKRQDSIGSQMEEIKTNYIAKFDDVKDKINQTEVVMKDKINETEKNILHEISKINVSIAQGNKDTREYRRKTK